MNNRYLMDRASRRGGSMRGRDGRNPYGSQGGYVTNRRGGRGRDRAMGSDYNYSEYDSRYDSRYDANYGGSDGHYPREQYRQSPRGMEYEMYGYGIGRPMSDYVRNDYRGNRDYDMNMGDYARGRDRDYEMRYYQNDYASEDMEKEYKEDLKEWCEKLKKFDKFKMPKNDIISQAKQMNVKFEEFDEEEFLCAYYLMMGMFKMDMLNSPQAYMLMAKNFLEFNQEKVKGSEKLCAYYYEIFEGGEKD